MRITNARVYAKVRLLVVFVCLGIFTVNASQMGDTLAEMLRPAERLKPSESRALLKQKHIVDYLVRTLTGAGGEDWAKPSSERLILAAEYGNQIAQSFDALLQAAAINRETNQYDPELMELMKFAAAAPNVKNALLREVTENPKFELKRNELLLHTGGFTGADVDKIVSTIKNASPNEGRALLGFYSDWGLVGLSSYYSEMLDVTPKNADVYRSKFGKFTEGEFHASIRVAATAFSYLGEAPVGVQERIRDLLNNYGIDVLGPQIQTLLRSTVEILEGDRPPAVKLAANGSGPINRSFARVEDVAATVPTFVAINEPSAVKSTSEVTRSSIMAATPASERSRTEPRSKLFWLIGTIVALGGIALGAVLMRRRV